MNVAHSCPLFFQTPYDVQWVVLHVAGGRRSDQRRGLSPSMVRHPAGQDTSQALQMLRTMKGTGRPSPVQTPFKPPPNLVQTSFVSPSAGYRPPLELIDESREGRIGGLGRACGENTTLGLCSLGIASRPGGNRSGATYQCYKFRHRCALPVVRGAHRVMLSNVTLKVQICVAHHASAAAWQAQRHQPFFFFRKPSSRISLESKTRLHAA